MKYYAVISCLYKSLPQHRISPRITFENAHLITCHFLTSNPLQLLTEDSIPIWAFKTCGTLKD